MRCVLPSMDYKGNTENENLLRQAVASTRKGRNLLLRLAAVFVIILVVILHGVYRNDGGRQEEPYEPLKSSSVLEELSTTPSTLLSADKDDLNVTDSIEEIFQFTNLTDTQIAAAEDGYRGQRELMMNGTGYDDIEAVQSMNSDPLPARLFHGKDAHEMCRSREGGCIAPFARIRPLIVTAPNHKIMSCVVQKSMSSVMLATMCYLLRGEEFIKAGRSLLFDLGAFGFCQNKNNFPNVDSMLETLRSTNPHDIRFTMITRDPVDRFLSGFVDRCIRVGDRCFGCRNNMTCFLDAEVSRAERYVRREITGSMIPRLTMEDMHIFPQNWRCDMQTYYRNYDFIRYSSDPSGTLLDDLSRILKEQNVSSSAISYISQSLSTGRTSHSTITTKSRVFLEQRLRSSPYLMEQIVRLFYHDYVLLHYPLPDLNSL